MEKVTTGLKPKIDLKKIYKKYKNCLKGAKKGQVVTRFPPEPSGYLHIGHVKAVFLNYHYAKIFDGQMVLRFDDTNPAKESQEFIDNIIKDLETLEIYPDTVTHTSDSFDLIADYCTQLITNGDAYCDNTPIDIMRKQRWDGEPSALRDTPVEENLKIWEEMKQGTDYGKEFCVRAKLSFNNKNKCLRDPTIYRCVDQNHPRTGDKWKVYPTYDFACPIVDSVEGVTHALRTTEYNDRKDQYKWFIKKLKLTKVKIQEYSRLAFVNTIISKRHLRTIVKEGVVEDWTDPRFPTVQAIIRRGMLLPTLVEFMLDQGPSRNIVLQEWDKIWSMNKKKMEKIAGKYNAVIGHRRSLITLTNVPETLKTKLVPVHKKNPDLGEMTQFISNKFFINFDDANNIKPDEKITLMNFMNVKVTGITPPADENSGYSITAEALPEDKDFKKTQKVSWVIGDENLLSKVVLVELEHLLTKPKLEDGDELTDFLNKDSKHTTVGLADSAVKNLPVGSYIQFQRIGNFRIDKKYIDDDGLTVCEVILIPTGKSKGMSNIKMKVNAKDIAKGGNI